MTFAELLRAYLHRAGKSQAWLARQAEVNIGTINHLLRGTRGPTRAQVHAFALVFGLGVFAYDELLYAAGLICSSCPMAHYTREKTRARGQMTGGVPTTPRPSGPERTMHQCPPSRVPPNAPPA